MDYLDQSNNFIKDDANTQLILVASCRLPSYIMDSFPEKNIPTKALVVEKPGAPFILEDITLDEVRPNELLVEIKYAGICHTVRDKLKTPEPTVSLQEMPRTS